MIICGLDQAPIGIGFAYGEPGSKPAFGWHENSDFGNATALLREEVWLWSVRFCKSIGAERIIHEQIIVRKFGLDTNVLAKQYAVVGGIEQAAIDLGLKHEVWEANIANWRTDFYAGLRPPKNCDSESAIWKDMALKECARRNWFTDNHNAAEACGIWDWACKRTDKAYRLRSRVDKRRQQSERDAARQAA